MAHSNSSPEITSGKNHLDRKEVLDHNRQVVRWVSDGIRSTLGPNGMDKMLVSEGGKITISNDGATILEEMEIEDPVGRMIAKVSRSQEQKAGDGTSTAVLLTAELLKESGSLMNEGVHPSSIIKGFNRAIEITDRAVDTLSKDIDTSDGELLRDVARSSMTGRLTEMNKEGFAEMAVEAVRNVTRHDDGETRVELDYAEVDFQTGYDVTQSELLYGAVVENEPIHPDMCESVDDGRIVLLEPGIQLDEHTTDITINPSAEYSVADFRQRETDQLHDKLERISELDVDVIFAQEEIDERAKQYLLNQDILAVHRVSKGDLIYLKHVLDIPITLDVDAVSDETVGRGSVEKINDRYHVRGHGEDGYGVTVLVRGSTNHLVTELGRGMEDALDAVGQTVANGRALPGGGAVEMAVARELRTHANRIDTREQLAIQAFANALEAIPYILAESAGLDPVDALIDLRNRHDAGEATAGVDTTSATIGDAFSSGIIDPVQVKKRTVSNGAEAASLVLKIDGIIASREFATTDEPEAPDMGKSMGEFSPITTSGEYWPEPEQDIDDIDPAEDQSETMGDIL
jgi:chaperonin GroEL (HSP60 family)